MEEQSNEALWYVVHTYSGYENKVAGDLQTLVKNRHLEDLICDIRIPTETVLEPVPVKKTTRKKKTSDYDDFSDAPAVKDDYIDSDAAEKKDDSANGNVKLHPVEHKLYPGYVFVKMVMNDDTWYVVRNTRGCTGFVGPSSKPVPLTMEEVQKMGVEKEAQLVLNFKVGDTVQITAGPLEGFMGVVEDIDTENFKVKLKVNMFGRETPAEVEIGQVELP